MTAGLSVTNLANKWLAVIAGDDNGATFTAPGAVYVQLHKGDPGAAGTSNVSSVTTRPEAVFDEPADGVMDLDNTPTWSNWAGDNGEEVTHVSLWDASSSGNFLLSAELTASKVINTGDMLTLPTLEIALTPLAATE